MLNEINDYNIKWNTQSKKASESMPFGGYNIGANVWVEDSQIFLYAAQTGWFDENNSLLKAGRIRIEINPCPFENDFQQELLLQDGYVTIKGEQFLMELWVEAKQPVVHFEVRSEIPRTIQMTYESWRTKDREVDHLSYELFQCTEMFFYPHANITFHGDQLEPEESQLLFYHQNQTNDLSITKEFKDQGIEEFEEKAYNPQKHSIFGGVLQGEDMKYRKTVKGTYIDTAYEGFQYVTETPVRVQHIEFALLQLYTTDCMVWKEKVSELIETSKKEREERKKETRAWWHAFWKKSYIMIEPEKTQSSAWEIGRNYQLFRYMLGCNYYGAWPTKFNGGLFTFTFDPSIGGDSPWSEDSLQYTPDFRLWGGGVHTIQNQRLLYWPLLKSGDESMIQQHFQFFLRTLETAKYRVKKNFGINGAMYPEQISTYGLCCGCNSEWGNQSGLPCVQIRYHFSNSLETILMMLEYCQFTNHSVTPYMEFIEQILIFYDEFYKEDDEDGKMILYPGNALETYHVVKNPIDALAGLQSVLRKILAWEREEITPMQREKFEKLLQRIPSIKTRKQDGHRILAYADTTSLVHNCEIPELYSVFPYGLYGIGKEDLNLAKDTARYAIQTEEQQSHISWHTTGIHYARLGMLAECEAFLSKKLGNGDFRFPAFWGPGHDWTPDHNWGGSGMIQLQEMLMQTEGDTILLLPCWPKEWDVSFRLHAPKETVVTCVYKNGIFEKIQVIPEIRKKDITMMLGSKSLI